MAQGSQKVVRRLGLSYLQGLRILIQAFKAYREKPTTLPRVHQRQLGSSDVRQPKEGRPAHGQTAAPLTAPVTAGGLKLQE